MSDTERAKFYNDCFKHHLAVAVPVTKEAFLKECPSHGEKYYKAAIGALTRSGAVADQKVSFRTRELWETCAGSRQVMATGMIGDEVYEWADIIR